MADGPLKFGQAVRAHAVGLVLLSTGVPIVSAQQPMPPVITGALPSPPQIAVPQKIEPIVPPAVVAPVARTRAATAPKSAKAGAKVAKRKLANKRG